MNYKMEVLKVDEWLKSDRPRYRTFEVEGKRFAQRFKDSEIFYIGQNVFRYQLPCTIISWSNDGITVWIRNTQNRAFYTNIDTLSITPR